MEIGSEGPDEGQSEVGQLIRHVISSIRDGKAVLFVGAGISRNSGVPIVGEMVPYILGQLGLDPVDRDALFAAGKLRMPFELFLQTLADHTNVDHLIDIFTLGTPNVNHFLLAGLMKAGYVRTIVTTNFDQLLETALTVDKMVPGRDFLVADDEPTFAAIDWQGSHTPRLVKIHGGVADRRSMAAMLRAVADRVRSEHRAHIIRYVFAEGDHQDVLVLGYSCSDVFDITPQIQLLEGARRRVIYVEHSDKERVCHISNPVEQNPFVAFADGYWLSCSTDSLVKELWEQLVGDNSGSYEWIQCSATSWRTLVDAWRSGASDLSRSAPLTVAGELLRHVNEDRLAVKYFARSLEVSRASGDRHAEADVLHRLGQTMNRLTRYQEALRCYEEALAIDEALGDKRGQVGHYASAAATLVNQGNNERALEYYQVALARAREVGDRGTMARVRLQMGIFKFNTQQYDSAIDDCEAALSFAEGLADLPTKVAALNSLASVHNALLQPRTALKFSEEALLVARNLQNTAAESAALNNVGSAYERLGRFERACEVFAAAAELAGVHGNVQHQAICLGNLANNYAALGDHETARRHYSRAISMLQEILGNDHQIVRLVEANLRQMERRKGEITFAAEDLFRRALSAADPELVRNLEMSSRALQQNQYRLASAYIQEVLLKAREASDPSLQANLFNKLARIRYAAGDYSNAIACLEESVAFARAARKVHQEADALGNMGMLYSQLGQHERAVDCHSKALTILESELGVNHAVTERERRDLAAAREALRKA
jgi:tetratricopeptide (TPR) repeat protein/NAD-dependent SIR2 family protein deacetylase